jgi:hypothetical protein
MGGRMGYCWRRRRAARGTRDDPAEVMHPPVARNESVR